MIEDEISALIAEHYQPEDQDRLLMLSNIGARLSKLGHWPLPPGDKRTLLEIVEAIPQVSVISDPEAKSFIAVVPAGQEQRAHDGIAMRRHRYFLRGLPRALLLAFTIELAQGEQMFVHLGPRVTYVAGPGAGDGDAIEVDADLRLPQLDVDELDALPNEDAQRLAGNIKEWCVRHQIDPASLKRRGKSVSPPRSVPPKALSALERLYAAQDPGIANRLTIPMDIALTLSRLP